jgi:hypothetical protein
MPVEAALRKLDLDARSAQMRVLVPDGMFRAQELAPQFHAECHPSVARIMERRGAGDRVCGQV